jgi:Alpha-L-arabinofuranosidase 1 domain/Alpha-L-arabinofuranosidase C-terminal domain
MFALLAIWLTALAFNAAGQAQEARIVVRAGRVLHSVSRYLTGACIEDVNHEVYGGLYSQMIFGESFQEPPPRGLRNLPVKTSGKRARALLAAAVEGAREVSGMWRALRRGSAAGSWTIEKDHPFVGTQSQRLAFIGGAGEAGVENEGLNRWGMYFTGGRPYQGVLWARADRPTEVWVAMESGEGTTVLAEKELHLPAGDWQRLEFSLVPRATVRGGRFAIELRQPGSVVLGYSFLEPGAWGRFKGLPVRRDVGQALVNEGITVLRYGGSMVNAREYRWKKMIGPRDRRPPYRGAWYPYSSNGWGILDFMNFCEAAGFEYVPAFNMDETPQDMADFIEYAKGPADSRWGRQRVADGHPGPYRLHYIELGNEERVDVKYAAKFEALAKAIWAKDPEVILVVGDFAYGRPIQDPFNFHGAASGITSLAGQQRILRFAKRQHREVWFDVHVGTDGPRPDASLAGMFAFRNALDKIADGARHKVVVFEFNAGNHTQRRALANALAIQAVERDGRIPIATSANCLQPDGQNDNGWDQGLLFLNPSQVWLQPPGYVTRMFSRNYLPQLVECDTAGFNVPLSAVATQSRDRRVLVLQVVNAGDKPCTARIRLAGFAAGSPAAEATELSGPLNAANTPAHPEAFVPKRTECRLNLRDGTTTRVFLPWSVTVMRILR